MRFFKPYCFTKHESRFAFTLLLVSLTVIISGCGISTVVKLDTQEMTYQKMGWLSVRSNDPSAISGYQRLQDEMKVSPNIENMVTSNGLPDYIKITNEIFFPKLEAVYCREGAVYQFSSAIPRNLKRRIMFSEYDSQLPACQVKAPDNIQKKTAELQDLRKEAIEISNMNKAIWHIDFTEVNGKQIPTTSISYVDGKAIRHISDAGAAPSPNSSLFAVVEVHNREMALVLKSGDKTFQPTNYFGRKRSCYSLPVS